MIHISHWELEVIRDISGADELSFQDMENFCWLGRGVRLFFPEREGNESPGEIGKMPLKMVFSNHLGFCTGNKTKQNKTKCVRETD